MSNQLFTLRLNYGGIWSDLDFEYVGGMVSVMADVDPNLMSHIVILNFIKELELPVTTTTVIWYKLPNENGLKLLDIDNDVGVLEMFKLYSDAQVFQIDMFLQDVDIDVSLPLISPYEADAEMGMGADAEVGLEGDADMGIDADEDQSDHSYVADSEYDSDSESDTLSDFDFFAEGDTMSESFHPLGTGPLGDDGDEINQPNDREIIPEINLEQAFDASEKNIQSDPEILSEPNESDEESKGGKFPEFDEEKSLIEPHLEVGLVFSNCEAYRQALKQYSVQRGIALIYDKNEKKRVTAKCKNKCGWRIHASVMGTSTAFQIKSFKGEPHKCPRSFTNKSASASYLADRYIDTFMENPTMPVESFKKLVRREVKVYAHRQKLYRAKKKAIEKIQGNVHEQYSRTRQYCYEILKTNPGSTAIVRVEGPPLYRNPVFQRIFVLYDAQKKGFLEGCRPHIGLDACFLKGPFGGQLMAAIARDGNNQMFPLAIAVVESECKESWGWFLNLLVSSFGNDDISMCTFISDRQKGLVESFNTILPRTEHRFCVRHLYANFKLRFKDKILRDLMWNAARAYLENGYKEKMDEIKAISKEAYEWLKNIPPQLWCKHMMSGRSKCDLLCNNLCESFNNYIKEARDMPILTMLEALRRQFMCRIHSKRLLIEKCSGKLCPRIQDKVNMIKENALEFECRLAANGLWEVSMSKKGWVVDLNRQTCSCKEWEMTGIPCLHATSAILMEHREPEDFVSHYYSLDMYKKAYSYTINPIPDHSQWVTDASNEQTPTIMPPPFKKQPGRPKKMRKKGPDEINVGGKLTRKGITQTCSNCGDITHNRRRCKKPPPPVNNQKIRKRKANTNLEGNALATKPSTQPATQAPRQGPTGGAKSNENGGRGEYAKGKKSKIIGYGNWNGVGLMQNGFRPPQQNLNKHDAATSTSARGPNNNTSRKDGDIQMQVQHTRFGPVLFSSQSRSNKFSYTAENGEF